MTKEGRIFPTRKERLEKLRGEALMELSYFMEKLSNVKLAFEKVNFKLPKRTQDDVLKDLKYEAGELGMQIHRYAAKCEGIHNTIQEINRYE